MMNKNIIPILFYNPDIVRREDQLRPSAKRRNKEVSLKSKMNEKFQDYRYHRNGNEKA